MTWGCSCAFTLAWLAEQGAPHAQRMRREKKAEGSWSNEDVLAHLAEEEIHFKGKMRSDRYATVVLHHAIVRNQIRDFKQVNQKFFKYHAELEDKWVREMVERTQ